MDGQRVQHRLPAVDLAAGIGPAGSSLDGHEVEDLEGGLFVGEVAAVPDGLAEPGVEALDRIRIRYDISGASARCRVGIYLAVVGSVVFGGIS